MALALAVVVTFVVGAAFGDAAAIAVAVVAGVAGFAPEIGDMQFCSGPPLGTKGLRFRYGLGFVAQRELAAPAFPRARRSGRR